MNLDQVRDLILISRLLSNERFEKFRKAWLEGLRSMTMVSHLSTGWLPSAELTEFQGLTLLAGIPGPYTLGLSRHRRITAGRLGDIFRAEQIEFHQLVSLKVFPMSLNQNPELVARLGREARVSLQVDSPYVVKTYQVGKVGPIPFIALEAMWGETLEQKLIREGCIPYLTACQLIYQAAKGWPIYIRRKSSIVTSALRVAR